MDNTDQLTELQLVLESADDIDFNYNKGSLLQGVLYEHIDSEYVDILHEQGVKPYSQCVRIEDGQIIWHIRTLSGEAYEKIIVPLLDNSFKEFEIAHNNVLVWIRDKSVHSISMEQLFNDFYSGDAGRYFTIEFNTPTAFKKEGRYSFYPELFNIYHSLMMRFDSVSTRGGMYSEDTLEQLTNSTEIVDYNLRSLRFGLEGVRIPSFLGKIRIRIHGSQTMINFANLLFHFGNYSGIGIKTALGMGSVRITEQRRKENK